jgi:hypothetical protein
MTDPIDARLDLSARAPARRWSRSRLALGLAPTAAPGLLLLPLGVALGPHGLGLLSPVVLSHLDPVIPVAVATLGVLAGLGLDLRRPQELRLLGAASVEAALTLLVVGAGAFAVLRAGLMPADGVPWLLALLLGVCAATSSTVPAGERSARARGMRIGDLDDVLPVVVAGLALAWDREGGAGGAAAIATQSVLVAAAVASAGWLLVGEAASDSERRVFVVGALLLVGGAAEALHLSALLAGLVAGACWNTLGGAARERIGADVRYVQHPLVVLLLVMAGAHLDPVVGFTALAAAYVACRVAGKLAGGWIVGRVVAPELPSHLGLHLLSPGVAAVALALDARQALDGAGSPLVLAVVVVGSIVSELLSRLIHPPEVDR